MKLKSMIKFTIGTLMIVLVLILNQYYYIGLGTGESMCPTYGTATLTFNKKIQGRDDIVNGSVYSYVRLYSNSKDIIHHRLIDNKYYSYKTFKGDNNNYTEKVYIESIIGKTIGYLILVRC